MKVWLTIIYRIDSKKLFSQLLEDSNALLVNAKITMHIVLESKNMQTKVLRQRYSGQSYQPE